MCPAWSAAEAGSSAGAPLQQAAAAAVSPSAQSIGGPFPTESHQGHVIRCHHAAAQGESNHAPVGLINNPTAQVPPAACLRGFAHAAQRYPESTPHDQSHGALRPDPNFAAGPVRACDQKPPDRPGTLRKSGRFPRPYRSHKEGWIRPIPAAGDLAHHMCTRRNHQRT